MATKGYFAVLISALIFLLSCEDIGNPQEVTLPPDQELIWVGKVFAGGVQCTQDQYTPPDTKTLLNQAGIAVFATSIEHYPVCGACGCPKYAAMHSALIKDSQLAKAEALGFRRIDPPPATLIYGKWNWLVSVGGIGSLTLRPPPIVRIEFDRSGVFSYYRNDTLVATTPFVIRREQTPMSADSSDVIHYRDSLRFLPQIYRVENDTLTLEDLCIDCYIHAYRRMR